MLKKEYNFSDSTTSIKDALGKFAGYLFLLGLIGILLGIFLIPKPSYAQNQLDTNIQHDLQFAGQQLTNTSSTMPTTSYPVRTNASGSWVTVTPSDWTSGFFPGTLWQMYQQTGNTTWLTKAQNWQVGVESQKNDTTTHDVGFKIFNSFGNAYRLTGNDAYRQVLLTAAASLASRYNAAVGCTKSWNGGDFEVIIDNMMNIELLFWASKHGGNSAWYNMAVNHALRTSQEHVRADGSTYHVVNYNPTSGAVISKYTSQGYSDNSTWSRGQAWAIYGFTMTYRETGDARFLTTARKVADYYINHLPSDYVPYWDFQAPNIPNEPRDTSAAAVAASGLLELSQLENDTTRKQTYLNTAKATINSLSSSAYLAEGTSNKAILLHGTQNKPASNYDTGLIFGDYYYVEALERYRWITPDTSPIQVSTVSASADNGNIASNTIDNNPNTRWAALGDGQWISYNLGASQTVGKVAITWYKGNERSTKFDIQTSTDNTNWTTVYSGMSIGKIVQQETYSFNDIRAQYVRIVGHGNIFDTENSISEVSIYNPSVGTPTPTITATPTLIPPTPTPVKPNLIINPSFELDTNGDSRPDSWTSDSRFIRTTEILLDGQYVGKHSSTTNASYTISQTIKNITAGKNYSFSGRVNIPSTSDSFTFTLRIQWLNSSGGVISTSTIKNFTAATSGWSNPTLAIKSPSGTTNAKLDMVVTSLNAKIYVDNFIFQ